MLLNQDLHAVTETEFWMQREECLKIAPPLFRWRRLYRAFLENFTINEAFESRLQT